MTVLVNSGRASVAKAIKDQNIHLAWGSGNPAWDVTPEPVDVDDTALVAEVGRRKVTVASYCTPNPAGELIVESGRFTVSPTPTKYLYLKFNYDYEDAPTATIRETAIFIGTTVKNTVPLGQEYLEPEDILSPGIMLSLEHTYLERSISIRQQFEFVIQF